MLAANVACPKCRSVLRVTQAVPGAQRLQCPQCATLFAVNLGNGAPQSSASVKTQRPARPQGALAGRRPGSDLPEGDEDLSALVHRVRKPGRVRGETGRMFLILGIAFLILAGIGVGVAFVLNAPKGLEKQNVQNEGTEDDGQKEKDGNPTEKPVVKTPASVDPELVALTREKQEKVNKAIDRAVAFLKKNQTESGEWKLGGEVRAMLRHRVGLTALPALTLLECGVAPDDAVVQKAAQYVREHCAGLKLTYDISLAILLLDRLKDPSDKDLIQALALRLVAGQTSNGGWSYLCPVLKTKDRDLLMSALKVVPLSPRSKLELVETPKTPDPQNKLSLVDPPNVNDDRPDSTKLMLDPPEKPTPKAEVALKDLPPHLKKLPVLQVGEKSAENLGPRRSDNSNTQFAILGLWAARNHGVPLDRSLALIVKRFRTSQFLSGGWSYGYVYTVGMKKKMGVKMFGRATMTCAGLLGLAVGHGLASDIKGQGALAGRDPAVDKALRAVGNALKAKGSAPWKDPRTGRLRYNLYLLWSVERVGVIYGLKRIGHVDWYNWGCDILLQQQSDKDGSWFGNGYHGADPITDTSFALLFLKRVNLARDLTPKLTLDDSR